MPTAQTLKKAHRRLTARLRRFEQGPADRYDFDQWVHDYAVLLAHRGQVDRLVKLMTTGLTIGQFTVSAGWCARARVCARTLNPQIIQLMLDLGVYKYVAHGLFDSARGAGRQDIQQMLAKHGITRGYIEDCDEDISAECSTDCTIETHK